MGLASSMAIPFPRENRRRKSRKSRWPHGARMSSPLNMSVKKRPRLRPRARLESWTRYAASAGPWVWPQILQVAHVQMESCNERDTASSCAMLTFSVNCVHPCT